MKPLATLVNAIAFTALFVAYASGGEVETPDGVRRALETYARSLPNDASPASKPVWQVSLGASARKSDRCVD